MKNLFTLLFLLFFASAHATSYYFSSVSGDDTRTSTQAKNPATPWKSTSKLNSYFSSLMPGDSVLFKRGESFYGSITVNKSGISGSPVVIGAFGSGSKPVITGLVTMSDWVSIGNGIYQSYNPSLGTEVNMVLLNNNQKGMGRYPNSDAPNKGYLTLESHVGKTSITDNELTSTPGWNGGELVLRTSRWTFERCKITSHSGRTIYYTANVGAYEPGNGYGYFIQNHIKALDQLGEWSYNPSTQKLSMFFGSNSPSSYTVKVATINNLFYASSKSYVVVDNITFKGAKGNGVNISGGSNITIKNCEVLFSGIDGVRASGINFKMENSEVLSSNNNGINASGGTAPQVRNNLVRNSYHIAGLGQSGNGQGAGIRNGKSGIVEYNQVINSGYVGVQLGGDYAVVKNNLIDTFCFVKDDGGGIYTSNGPNITNYGRKIIGNIILNGLGANAGTTSLTSAAEAIYMDDNANGTEITGNTVANSHRGIFLHNTRNIVVRNNTCYNNSDGQLNIKYDALGELVRYHTISKNIFFSKYAKDIVSALLTKRDDNDIIAFGRFDSNYYARPLNNTDLIQTQTYVYTASQVKTYRDLPEWKSKYNKDHAANLGLKTIVDNPDGNILFVYNPSQESKTVYLNASYVDAKNIRYTNGSITLKPYASAVLVKDGAATTTTNAAPTVSITSPVTNTTFATPTSVTLNALAADTDGAITKVSFYNGATLLGTDVTSPYTFTWSGVAAGNYTITAKATDNGSLVTTSAAVNFSVSPNNVPPSVSITNIATNITFGSPVSVTISAAASDADGAVSKVQFYKGDSLLGNATTSPYNFTWNNVAPGTYTVTAKAIDDKGAATTSSRFTISVVPPTVSLRPLNNNSSNVLTNVAGASINLKVFPNPATNIVLVSGQGLPENKDFVITVLSTNGSILKTIRSNTSNRAVEVNVSALHSGAYIIKATTGSITMNKKFVKL